MMLEVDTRFVKEPVRAYVLALSSPSLALQRDEGLGTGKDSRETGGFYNDMKTICVQMLVPRCH